MFSTENQPQEASGYVPVTNAQNTADRKGCGVDTDVARKSADGTYSGSGPRQSTPHTVPEL